MEEYREEIARARVEALRSYAAQRREARLLDEAYRSSRPRRWGRAGRHTGR